MWPQQVGPFDLLAAGGWTVDGAQAGDDYQVAGRVLNDRRQLAAEPTRAEELDVERLVEKLLLAIEDVMLGDEAI
jgi:hypothetical protein